jgi:hypothetical protein
VLGKTVDNFQDTTIGSDFDGADVAESTRGVETDTTCTENDSEHRPCDCSCGDMANPQAPPALALCLSHFLQSAVVCVLGNSMLTKTENTKARRNYFNKNESPGSWKLW